MHRVNSVWILLCTSFFGQFLYAQTTLLSGAERVYIGLLDDAREEMVDWKPGVASERLIRPAFEKTRSGWRQVESASIPARMNWTVAFHGKNIGRVTSQAIPSASRPKQGHTEYLTAVQAIVTPSIAVPSVVYRPKSIVPWGLGQLRADAPWLWSQSHTQVILMDGSVYLGRQMRLRLSFAQPFGERFLTLFAAGTRRLCSTTGSFQIRR